MIIMYFSVSFLIIFVKRLSCIILKTTTRQCQNKISRIIKFELLFFRMQMNGRVKLQGEQRILSIHLCSTSKSKGIQKKSENKGWLMFILSSYMTFLCRHLFEVNHSCILSFPLSFSIFRNNKKIPENESWWRGGICKTFKMTFYSVKESLNRG